MNDTPKSYRDIYHFIVNSVSQLAAFRFARRAKKSIAEIREMVKEAELKTLEEYTGRTTAELNDALPGICTRFNSLVEELKSPELSIEQFDKIIAQIEDPSWYSRPKK